MYKAKERAAQQTTEWGKFNKKEKKKKQQGCTIQSQILQHKCEKWTHGHEIIINISFIITSARKYIKREGKREKNSNKKKIKTEWRVGATVLRNFWTKNNAN